jgi:septin family protein
VQGDQENRFTDFAEAVTFIQQYLTALTMDTLGGEDGMSQEKAFEESFKFWDQFSTSYAKMMSNAMEQSVKQSKVIQDQVEETREKMLNAWQFPFQPNQNELLKTFNKMQAQMEDLANKVEELEKKLNQQNSET